jgi:hypothetical protein
LFCFIRAVHGVPLAIPAAASITGEVVTIGGGVMVEINRSQYRRHRHQPNPARQSNALLNFRKDAVQAVALPVVVPPRFAVSAAIGSVISTCAPGVISILRRHCRARAPALLFRLRKVG